MNILVVDDQSYVVDGVVAGVDWDKIGVDHVFKAFTGSHAMEVIKNNNINIVIVDIEMPVINGMELAEWIRNYNSDIAVIFLTSHADFEYAQQAIRIGCFDYIVQPIEYGKLETSIKNVINKLQIKNDMVDLYGNGLKWKSMQQEINENFWNKVVLRRPRMNLIQIEQERKKIEINLNWQDKYILVLVKILNQSETLNHWIENHSSDALQKLMRIIINENLPVVQYMQMDGVSHVYIIKDSEVDYYFQLLVDTAKRDFQCNVACYISSSGEIEELSIYMDDLLELSERNVVPYTGTFHNNISMEEDTVLSESLPSVNQWFKYFQNHEEDKLYHEIHFTLEKYKVEGKLNRKLLLSVQQILLHAYYMSLKSAGREIPDLIDHEEILRNYVEASKSLLKLYQMVDELIEINRTISYTSPLDTDLEDTIFKIKDYITKNIDHELTRQELADYVFMSKDYISHLFKKKEGVNLIDYINDQKIRMAKQMLEETKIPVNMVALKVGISNYAYFSKLFKKLCGMSASEYREQNK
jgi:Response regulator containing CheY-like receiver domain and AraC-type DNA-binding domain